MGVGKEEKKKNKIKERIKFLEDEMTNALTKKTSNSKEINISEYQNKINVLKKELRRITETVIIK